MPGMRERVWIIRCIRTSTSSGFGDISDSDMRRSACDGDSSLKDDLVGIGGKRIAADA